MERSRRLLNLLALFAFILHIVTPVTGLVFKGCYRENRRSRVFGVSPGNWDRADVTPAICSQQCGNVDFEYAGVTSGAFCFCSNVLPDPGALEPGQCTTPCAGLALPSETCGSTYHVSVYKTALGIVGLAVDTVGSDMLEINTLSTFQTDMNFGPSDRVYMMDYDTGAGKTGPNATDLLQQTFTMPGEYVVTAYATDSDAATLEVKSSLPVLVQSPVREVALTCPTQVMTYEEFRCNATVLSGTYMTAAANYGDAATDNFPIVDPIWHSAGPGVAQHGPQTSTGSNTSSLYVMPSSEFRKPGTVMAWEYYATVAGPVTFLVLSPACLSLYCSKDNACAGSCTPPSEYNCVGSDTVFCAARGTCTDPATMTSNCNPAAGNRYATPLGDFTVKGEVLHTITTTGWNKLDADLVTNRIDVNPGDIIGFTTTTALLATRDVDLDETQDRRHNTLSTVTIGGPLPNNWGGAAKRHQLRAVAARPSQLLLFHTYMGDGNFTVQLNLSNAYTGSWGTASAFVVAQVGINITDIQSPMYAATNEAVSFTLGPHTGSDVTYEWNFGDGSAPVVGWTDRTIPHTFLSKGTYTVNATAANLLASKSNITTITIQDRLTGLQVNSNYTGVNQLVGIGFSLASGSDYQCTWDFGDGSPLETTNETSTPASGATVPHVYTSEGAFTVAVSCANDVSLAPLSVTLVHNVMWPITNLRLESNSAEKNTPFHIAFNIDQGSSPTFTLDFDGTDLPVTFVSGTKRGQTNAQLSGKPVGMYPLVLRGLNLVSDVTIEANFSIEVAIVNAKSSVSNTTIIKGNSVSFYVTMDEGSSAQIFVDFKDDENETFSMPFGQNWAPGAFHIISHTFNRGGVFDTEVVVSNGYNSFPFTHRIQVLSSVTNLTLVSDDPAAFHDGSAFVTFGFTSETGELPGGSFVTFDFGDNSGVTAAMPFAATGFTHSYPATGNYTARATVYNAIDSETYSVDVQVIVPVTNLHLHVVPSHVALGESVSLGLSMHTGMGVTLFFGLGDGSPVITQERVGENVWYIDKISHTYASTGAYTVTAVASNALGNTTIDYILKVQHPVTRQFSLVSNAPKVFSPGSTRQIDFDLSFPAVGQLPDSALVTWVWGDGTSEPAVPLPFSAPPHLYQTSHIYAGHADYKATVTIANLVGMEQFVASAGVYEAVSGVTLVLRYQPELPLGGPDRFGHGPGEDTFPLHLPVKFYGDVLTGTVTLYRVTAVHEDGSTIHACNSTTNPAEIQFTKAGRYDVTVTASNGLPSEASMDDTVTVLETVTGVTIDDFHSVTKPREEKSIEVAFSTIPIDACVFFGYGDGHYEAYGDLSLCPGGGDGLVDKVTGPVVNPFKLVHTYTKKGRYQFTVAAHDFFGSLPTENLEFTVSKSDCQTPILDIKDRAPTLGTPREALRSLEFTVIGRVELECAATLDNQKVWTVQRVDEQYGKVISNIDLSSLRSISNAEVAIPSRFLDYGTYIFTFRVTMAGNAHTDLFSGETHTYIKVVKSPLIPALVPGGMTVVVRGDNEMVTLDPGKLSRDPDLRPDQKQDFSGFQFFCRQIDEEWPRDEDGDYATTNPSTPYTAAHIAAGVPDNKGCFRSGPGAVSTSPPNSGSLTFSTKNMFVNETYEFVVVVRKDTRQAEAVLRLEIVAGSPPSVVIRCKDDLCTPVYGGLRINPSNRLALVAECANCGPSTTWAWSVDYAGLNDAWLPAKDLAKFIRAKNSPEVSISQALFEEGFLLYANMTRYRVRLTAQAPGGTKGVSYTVVTLNKAPSGGSCSVSPDNGQVMKTTFTLKCENWQDDSGIALYQFYVKRKGQEAEIQITFGEESEIEAYLPLGSDVEGADFRYLDVHARIVDSYGSAKEWFIKRVKVESTSEAELDFEIDEMLNNGQHRLIKALAEEDMQTTNKECLRAASGLNTAQYTDYGMGPCETQKGYTAAYAKWQKCPVGQDLTPEQREATRVKYEYHRNRRGKVRTVMTKTLAKMTKAKVKDIKLALSTLAVITEPVEEVSRDAMEAIADVFVDVADTMERLSATTPLDQLEISATAYLSLVGNVLEAKTHAVTSGMVHDRAQATESEYYYYDTDLETSRESLIDMDLEDASSALVGETQSYYQKHKNKAISQKSMDGADKVGKVLLRAMVAGESSMSIVTPKLAMMLDKDLASNVLGKTSPIGQAKYTFPKFCKLTNKIDCSDFDVVGLKVMATPVNAYDHFNDKNKSRMVPPYSSTITIDLLDSSTKAMNISETEEPIVILIPRDIPLSEPTMHAAVASDTQASYPSCHSFNLTTHNSSIHFQIVPKDKTTQLLVFVRYEHFPDMDGNDTGWELWQTLPKTMADTTWDASTDPHPYTVMLSNKQVANRLGKWYVCIRALANDHVDKYSDATAPPSPTQAGLFGADSFNYTLLIYSSGCRFFDAGNDAWGGYGCEVGSLTKTDVTQCICNHLTSFGGGWLVEPNAIDFDFVFSNADFASNPTLYVTQIMLAVVYIIFAIWARRKDRKDAMKLGVTPLPDNSAGDKYYYEVVVQTGLRSNAGTDSKVHFILSGEFDETEVRVLEDSQRKVLRRGETDTFLLAVPRPLGPLSYARIWHDNSGKGKFGGWYCNYFIVHDLQTRKRSYFIINKWFAVEEGDGQIDRLVPVANEEDMKELGHLLSQRATRSLGDDHLWFSVIARPPQSRFTRLQRVSCCLLLLFTSMLANAMFYEQTADGAGQNALTFGPFALSPEQIYIGVISNLIVFPINLLIVSLFRKARPRQKRSNRIKEAIRKAQQGAANDATNTPYAGGIFNPNFADSSSTSDLRAMLNSGGSSPDCDTSAMTKPLSPALPAHGGLHGEDPRPTTASAIHMDEQKKPKKKFSLPWWFNIVGWVLLWASVAVSVAFVTFYGIMFQDLKVKKWITSLVVSFLMSIFLTQPIKVFLLAVFFSLVFKKADIDDEDIEDDEEVLEIGHDEEFLHPMPGDPGYMPKRRKLTYKPPDPVALELARELRRKELMMYDILREVVLYGFFLWILLVVSYGFRDPNAFFLKQNIQTNLMDLGRGRMSNATNNFKKARRFDDFWDWSNNTLSRAIRADVWYNDDPPIGQRGFIFDRTSRMMGYATMRQLRIKKNLCDVVPPMHTLTPDCYSPYEMSEQEEGHFGVGWEPLLPVGVNSTIFSNSKAEYMFRSASALNGYPFWASHALYDGGGYVVELRGSIRDLRKRMSELRDDGWIDRLTRAIFVEFTVYNPAVNLFGIVTFVAEFIQSGGMHTYTRVEPMNLIGYASGARLFQMICQAVYLLFILFFIVKEIRKLVKHKKAYFKEPWNYIELLIIALSITGTAIYFYRMFEAMKLTSYFNETHGDGYTKFQYVAYWNELLLYIVGWLCFLASVKFIRLLRFNRRMSMLGQTLRIGAKPLALFGIIFGIVFMAYSQFFYLVYFMELYNFTHLIFAMETCLQMLVGKFNFSDMQFASPVLGPMFFFFYVVTVYYILINMFLTILNESFAAVRRNVELQSNEYEMVDFIIKRFQQWTGLGNILGGNKKDPNEEDDADKKKGEIEQFPEKVEQLMDCISKAYFDQDTFEALFYSTNSNRSKEAVRHLMKNKNGSLGVMQTSRSASSLRELPEVDEVPRYGGGGGGGWN